MLLRGYCMEKQLGEILGCNVQIAKIDKLTSLPIFMSIRKIDIIKIANQSFALVDISEESTLTVSAMKKQCQKYEEELQMPVAYKLEIDSIAMRNVLIKNGICFISLPGNIYLPFLGVVLQDVHKKKSIKIDKMMPATQMLFLELLYQDSDAGYMKSEAARRLNLTKTSITRATAQLKSMGLIMQRKWGTEINIVRNYPRREYFEKARSYLINPVQRIIEVKKEENIFNLFVAGETALSSHSSLNPPEISEFAMYKGSDVVEQLQLTDSRYEEKESCMRVQLWKYNPAYFAKDGKVDMISLACSLADMDDERIEMSIEEMLEEL